MTMQRSKLEIRTALFYYAAAAGVFLLLATSKIGLQNLWRANEPTDFFIVGTLLAMCITRICFHLVWKKREYWFRYFFGIEPPHADLTRDRDHEEFREIDQHVWEALAWFDLVAPGQPKQKAYKLARCFGLLLLA